MKISQKLQAILKSTGLTQTQLAQKFGVSFVSLNRWISEKSSPRRSAVLAIEQMFEEYFGKESIMPDEVSKKITTLIALHKKYPRPLKTLLSRKDLYDHFVLLLTYNTNSIEGSTFNEPEVRAVLFDGITIPDKSVVEHQEAKNHQAALGNLFKMLSEGNFTIDEILIKKLHAILMNGILPNAGAYRTHSVRVTGSSVVTVNHQSIEKRIAEYVAIVNKDVEISDVPNLLAKSHAFFEQIHPFSDGNGRVGRLLLHITAIKYGLLPIIIRKEKKIAYYRYLERAQTLDNNAFLESFMIDALLDSFKQLQ